MSTVHRIFRIGVGQLPSHKAHAYLERVKKDVEKEEIPDNYIDYFIGIRGDFDTEIEFIETEVCDCKTKN